MTGVHSNHFSKVSKIHFKIAFLTFVRVPLLSKYFYLSLQTTGKELYNMWSPRLFTNL